MEGRGVRDGLRAEEVGARKERADGDGEGVSGADSEQGQEQGCVPVGDLPQVAAQCLLGPGVASVRCQRDAGMRCSMSGCDMQRQDAMFNIRLRFATSGCDMQRQDAVCNVRMRSVMSACDMQCQDLTYDISLRYSLSACDVRCA
eukprot:26673-Rhodomonas_salina.1